MSDAFGPSTGLPFPDLTTTDSTIAAVPADTNGYIQLPVTVDPLQLTADAFGFIQAQVPGWVPHEGHLEAWLIEACARMVSTTAQVASQVPVAIFEYLGGQLLGVTPNNGAPAETTTTWTMVNDQGYTVPAGTLVAFATSGSTLVQFTTTETFTIPVGETATAAGAVTIQATAAGTAANGIPAGPVTLVAALAYVASVESTATTAGGADPETTGGYLNRLAQQLQLLSPRPVLAADYAILAASQPGVARALALDNTNPYANLLTAVDASLETGEGSWAAVSNCALSVSTAWGLDGTHSLAMTSTASGLMTAKTGWYAVTPDTNYTALASFHAAVTAVPCAVNLVWADINFNVLSTSSGTTANDSTSGGVQRALTAESPATAAYVAVECAATASASTQIQDVDEIGLFLGTATSWTAGGKISGQERCVTVVPVDVDGNPLTSAQMTTIAAVLEAQRETNFLIFVVPPTYTAVVLSAAIVTTPTADLDTVQAAVAAALTNYLSPANWAGGTQTPPVWLNDTVVRYLNVAAVINSVPGVQYISTLTLNGNTTDCPLSGYAPLPLPTINVTATAGAIGT